MSIRHILTGEYPPAPGGVAGYTATVATALADAGERVHVWCPGNSGTVEEGPVTVHRTLGAFGRKDLGRVGELLSQYEAPRHLLLQWVPHAFGRRGVNVGFSRWMRNRVARHGDVLDVMIHEPFLPLTGGAAQVAGGLIQRLMARTILRDARRTFVATPAWGEFLAFAAPVERFEWMPVPSGIAIHTPAGDRETVLRQFRIPAASSVIGSFGSTGAAQVEVLAEVATQLPAGVVLLVIGSESDRLRQKISTRAPRAASNVFATGSLEERDVSMVLGACDLALQPYPDGVCGRHSSAMALLAHGVPLLTTIGRFTEPVWRDSAAMISVPAEHPTRIAPHVLDLLQDDERRRQMRAAARELYDSHFDVRHTVARLRHSGGRCGSPS